MNKKIDNRIVAPLLLTAMGVALYFSFKATSEVRRAERERIQPLPAPVRPPRGTPPYPIRGESLITNATVSYYPVTGSTEQELWASYESHHQANHWVGETSPNVKWVPGDTSDGRCGASTGRFWAEPVVELPKWDPPPDATDEAKWLWDDIIHDIAIHEQRHVDDDHRIVNQSLGEMRISDCKTLPETRQRVADRMQQAINEYHAWVARRGHAPVEQ